MKTRQQGALSLFWCAVLVSILSLGAMLGLLSMRYDRNLFADSWKKLAATAVKQAPAVSVMPTSEAIHKCIVNGSATYSNVECKESGRKIEIAETRGFEAPKPPTPMLEPAAGPTVHDKIIEKATSR